MEIYIIEEKNPKIDSYNTVSQFTIEPFKKINLTTQFKD